MLYTFQNVYSTVSLKSTVHYNGQIELYPLGNLYLRVNTILIIILPYFRNADRPKVVVLKARLENMQKLNLPISRIARKLDVSRPVVYNTIEQYTIKLHAVH